MSKPKNSKIDIKILEEIINDQDFELLSFTELEKKQVDFEVDAEVTDDLENILKEMSAKKQRSTKHESAEKSNTTLKFHDLPTSPTSPVSTQEVNNIPSLKELKRMKGVKQIIIEKLKTEERHRIRVVLEMDGKTTERIIYNDLADIEEAKPIPLPLPPKPPAAAAPPTVTKEDDKILADKSIEKKMQYSSYTFGPKKERKSSKYFYKIENHQELYKIGNSFFQDFNKGVKNFAFCTTTCEMAQKKTVLGLASYFGHKQKMEILIFSHNLYDGMFKDLIEESDLKTYESVAHGIKSFHYFSGDSFDIVDFNELKEYRKSFSDDSYRELIDSIVDRYDIVLWDVPPTSVLESDRHLYFPLSMKFEQISLTVGMESAKFQDVKKLISYYKKYGHNIKGVLIDKKARKKKRFWDFFSF